jgi:flavin-dependent dehydrogenase
MLADAVIIGTGPAGCAAAIGLARSGARVVMFHRKATLGCRPGEIIEPTFRITLAEIGLEKHFAAVRSLMLAGNVSVWDDETPVKVDGMTNPYGLGALIDRTGFEEWLMSAARRSGVLVLQTDGRLDAEAIDNRWRIGGAGNALSAVVTAPLVIQATGRGKGLVGPRERKLVDRLVALLMYGSTPPGPKDQRLLIEAGHHGWWYAAPLPDNRAVVSFMTDVDLLPTTSEGRTNHFHAQLQSTQLIAPFAAHMQATLPNIGFPANSGIRKVIHGKGWVCIGDAAATYDPLSGRGVPVALAKGAAIARLMSNDGNTSRALEAYVDAERAAFADFRVSQRRTYRRASARFDSEFWQRRSA